VPDERFITAKDQHVVIIGGGDTGADCLGTVHRQGAASVHQFELLPRPPDSRAPDNPWPQWPNVFRVSPAHEEGGERVYAVSTQRFTGDAEGHVRQLHAVTVDMVRDGGRLDFRPVPGTGFTLPADLVLLAMGFLGPERKGLVESLGLELTERGNVKRDRTRMTSVPGVFTCGDMQRGQSLIVWATGRAQKVGVRHAIDSSRTQQAHRPVRRRPPPPPRRAGHGPEGSAPVAPEAGRVVGARGRRPLLGLGNPVRLATRSTPPWPRWTASAPTRPP
jgi:glutamate synthase (NADPH/NADH) small chain